jgi:hypothetical protein
VAVPKAWMVAGSSPRDYEYGTDTGKSAEGGKSAFIKSKPQA